MSTYRVRVLASAAGQKCHNVLHVSAGDAPIQEVADDFATAWRARILANLSGLYTFEGVEVENIDSEDVGVYSAGTGGPTVGAGDGVALPTFVCASVRLVTGRRGRAGQGRLGLGPIAEAVTTTDINRMTVGAQGAIKASVDGFITDIGSSGGGSPMTLAVVSYYKGVDAAGKPIKRPEPLISAVTSTSVNAVLGTRLSRHPNR